MFKKAAPRPSERKRLYGLGRCVSTTLFVLALLLYAISASGEEGFSLEELERALDASSAPTPAEKAPEALPTGGASPTGATGAEGGPPAEEAAPDDETPPADEAAPIVPRDMVTPGPSGPEAEGPGNGPGLSPLLPVRMEPDDAPDDEEDDDADDEALLGPTEPIEPIEPEDTPAAGEDRKEPPEPLFVSPPRMGADFEAFRQEWSELSRIFEAEQPERVRELLQNMCDRKRDLGIKNLTSYSAALIRIAFKLAEDEGGERKAEELIGFARKLSPTWPQSWFSSALFEWRKSGSDVRKVLGLYKQGYELSLRSVKELTRWTANGLIASGLAVFAALAFYAAACLYRRLSPLSHELAHLMRLQNRIGPRLARWLAVSFCFLPLLAGLGPFWLLVIWFALCWPFLDRPSRRTSSALTLIVLLSAPFYLEMLATVVVAPESGGVREVIRVREDEWDEQTLDDLVQWINVRQDDYLSLFAAGNLLWRGGNYEDAERIYLKTVQAKPNFFPAFINLGDLYAMRAIESRKLDEELPRIEKLYSKALDIEPDSALVRYNLGQLYSLVGRRDEGEAKIREATEIDKALVERLVDRFSTAEKLVVAEADIPLSDIWARLGASSPEKSRFKETLWKGAFIFFPLKSFLLLSLGIAAFFAVLGNLAARRSWSRYCPECGLPRCERCGTEVEGQTVCAQCYNAVKKKEGVDARVRLNKMVEIKRFGDRQRLIARILAFAVPGGGHMLNGMTIRGILAFAVCATVALAMLTPLGFIRREIALWAGYNPPGFMLTGLFGLAVYALSILDYFREE